MKSCKLQDAIETYQVKTGPIIITQIFEKVEAAFLLMHTS